MKINQQKSSVGLSRRLNFPDDEKRIPWLSRLLDAYAVADTGIAIAIRDAEKKGKRKLACGKGCGNCCVHQTDIPVYPHELVGIYWYVSEKMTSPMRDTLKSLLSVHAIGPPCPFLIEGSCSIHPLRPIGCRQFNVFTTTCESGEDPYYTRRDEVLVPIADYTDRAFAAVLAFYHLDKDKDVAKAVKLVRGQIMNLLEYDWKKLVKVMGEAEADRSATAS